MRRILQACVLLALIAAPAVAGDVLRLDGYVVDIYFDERNRRVAEKVHSICARDVPELAAELGMADIQPIEIRVEDDITPYRRSLGSNLPTWGVAFAVMEEGLIVVDVKRATRAWNSLDRVIPHELSHLLVSQRVPRVRFPIWFLEGLAQWQAGEWSLVDSWQLMNAVWGNEAPRLWQLDDRYPVHEEHARTAYRLSHAAFSDLFDDRAHRLPAFLDLVGRRGSFDQAFDEFFGVDVATFALHFHEDLQKRYHSRLLVFQTGPLFSILAVIFFAVGLRHYLRKRRKLRELDAADGGMTIDDV